jgi:hypothetical protein
MPSIKSWTPEVAAMRDAKNGKPVTTSPKIKRRETVKNRSPNEMSKATAPTLVAILSGTTDAEVAFVRKKSESFFNE